MSERTVLLPSSFCWPELASPDTNRAKPFYAGLFGWTAVDIPSSGGTYMLLQLRGKDVAGLRGMMPGEVEGKVPSHFLTYISTASADASAAKVDGLGGKVLSGPFDVENIGRMAVIQDPEGVVFAVWEARGHMGVRIVGEDGALCWTELMTRDAEKAKAFYGGLFGWTFKASQTSPVEYIEIYREDQPIGGILPMKGEGWGDMKPQWNPYFAVADCRATVAKAGELGGGAVVPATEIPNVGTFAILRDPLGAGFAVLTPAPVPAPVGG